MKPALFIATKWQMLSIKSIFEQVGDCEGSTLAYVTVWCTKDTEEFVRSDRVYDNHDDSEDFVVHVCEYFWDVVDRVEYRSRAGARNSWPRGCEVASESGIGWLYSDSPCVYA